MNNFTPTANISMREFLLLTEKARCFDKVCEHLDGLVSEVVPETNIQGFQTGNDYKIKESGGIQRYGYIQCKLAFAVDVVNDFKKGR